MPHFIVEYTANLEHCFEAEPLFELVHQHLIDLQMFPTGGIRSRARRIEQYRFADGARDYAGIHVELKLSSARAPQVRQEIGEQVFEIVRRYCLHLRKTTPYLALSMEVSLLHPEVFFNDNNLHDIFGLVP